MRILSRAVELMIRFSGVAVIGDSTSDAIALDGGLGSVGAWVRAVLGVVVDVSA
jgi:hypothetical protein